MAQARPAPFTRHCANAVYGTKPTALANGTMQDLALTAMNPDAALMRTDDEATAMQAYLSGQADVIATNSLVVLDVAKMHPEKEFDRKSLFDRVPAHLRSR